MYDRVMPNVKNNTAELLQLRNSTMNFNVKTRFFHKTILIVKLAIAFYFKNNFPEMHTKRHNNVKIN